MLRAVGLAVSAVLLPLVFFAGPTILKACNVVLAHSMTKPEETPLRILVVL